jgi:peptidoglycan/xylan/chitin deacetylase (PgdA/CDA1 family)
MLTHPAFVLKTLYPSLIWNIETKEKVLFLTFDDGPTKGVTDPLLDLLKQYGAKATFFCVGKNIQSEPELFQRILDEGHVIGNHTYNHKNGWTSNNLEYLKDVKQFDQIYKSKLFRPPYGRLKPAQINALKQDYKIMMWSALSMDYHSRVSKEECFENASKKLKMGDILVFHDSLKAKDKMLYAVEKVLETKGAEGFRFIPLGD